MLTSLATGLREGARFEVATAPLSDPNAAQAAANDAEAVALFYGGPAAVQALSARLRDRGGRVVAVLQRDQLPQRDDCFRAGASDLLFMPMPKEQFVNRLLQAVSLSFDGAGGPTAEVTVATRTATVKLASARVTASGIEAETASGEFKAGETVRLTFGAFNVWGLTARAEAPLQIRFAGLTPDEEGRIRKWIEGGAAENAAPESATQSSAPPLTTPGGSVRAAPAAGPPPGFADRKPVRASTRPSSPRMAAIVTPPFVSPVAPAVPHEGAQPGPASEAAAARDNAAAGSAESAAASTQEATAASSSDAAAISLQSPAALSSEEAAAGLFADSVQLEPAAPQGPSWPAPYSLAACKTAALMILADTTSAPEANAAVVASARKVTFNLGSAEREALQKAGADSSFADALAARVALDAAASDGAKLHAASAAPSIDAQALSALTKAADEAAARLQKEASTAVTKGEVESLQLITAASAALSRDLLAFKETADRLRGLAAAPRLGAGALDPHLAVPGHTGRAVSSRPAEKQVARAELRDFQALDGVRSQPWKKAMLALGVVALIALGANALFFSIPQMKPIAADAAGKNVQSIEVHGNSALVVVTQDWIDNAQSEEKKLVEVLRQREVVKAMLMTATGRPAGILDVQSGRIVGLPQRKK
jgi:hypothetical protein